MGADDMQQQTVSFSQVINGEPVVYEYSLPPPEPLVIPGYTLPPPVYYQSPPQTSLLEVKKIQLYIYGFAAAMFVIYSLHLLATILMFIGVVNNSNDGDKAEDVLTACIFPTIIMVKIITIILAVVGAYKKSLLILIAAFIGGVVVLLPELFFVGFIILMSIMWFFYAWMILPLDLLFLFVDLVCGAGVVLTVLLLLSIFALCLKITKNQTTVDYPEAMQL